MNNMTSQKFFQEKKYIYLSDVLNKDQCKDLNDYIYDEWINFIFNFQYNLKKSI